jgi:Domain of Unknown Function (DUF913)
MLSFGSAGLGDAGEASPPATPAEVEAFLPECIGAASRMLESLLSNADTARAFVEGGGIPLLLALYALPLLPPTFGSSSPSHALLSAFR